MGEWCLMRGEPVAKRYLFVLRRARDLTWRVLAALAIFVLAWLLSLAGGTVGQTARNGIDYVLHSNYNLRDFNYSPVIDRVSALLGIKRGLDVQVATPIPQGDAAVQQPGLPVDGKLARGFGWQKDSDGWPRFSDGVELTVVKDAPVRAVLPGTVSRIFNDPNLGTVVVIDHSDQLATLYGRLETVGVQTGQQVDQGQVLGKAAGAFLHFEMRDGDQLVDPVQHLQQNQS
jgi:murein DD-endopeptidase MepM/ murein hydrolase activator NlpD